MMWLGSRLKAAYYPFPWLAILKLHVEKCFKVPMNGHLMFFSLVPMNNLEVLLPLVINYLLFCFLLMIFFLASSTCCDLAEIIKFWGPLIGY